MAFRTLSSSERTADGARLFLGDVGAGGGANIADLIEAASGLNLWAEWAKVEVAAARGGGLPGDGAATACRRDC